jgi:hypothetical protein
MNEYWPPLVVRRWQEILYSRNPDDWFDRDHDPIEEAVISRPLHELRGLIVGQVAEIESLLLHVAQEIRDRHTGTLPGRQKRKGAGGALQDVRKLLAALALEDELSAELERTGRVIDRRNRLVHGVIHIGFSRLDPQAPLEPVISLLFENDSNEAMLVGDHGIANSAESPDAGDEEDEAEEDYDLGEFELKKYLNEAYDALDAGLTILSRVDDVLPERTYGWSGAS